MNVEEFAFAYNINSTGMSGIITMTNPPKLVCYCDEENSKTILNALNPPLPPAEGAEAQQCPVCMGKGLVPNSFYATTSGIGSTTQTYLPEKCRTCNGAGVILPSYLQKQQQPTAEGAELKDDKPCNKCTYNGHTTICEQCNDGNDYEHFTYNDPYSKESMNFFKVFIKARKDLCAISPTETYSLEEAIRKAFDGFFPQPTAEGAEEILESIVESLGEPINIHNHIFEIRPYTVEHKTEWWIFHKEVGSGEPLAQWLQNFATLHAQRIAEKMVSERKYTAQDIDLAYTTGVFNVVGIDGLGEELKRLNAIGKKPHDIFRNGTEGGE